MDGMKCAKCGGGTLRIMEFFPEGTTDRYVCLDSVACERRELEQENARLRAIVEPLERLLAAGRTIELDHVGQLYYVADWLEPVDGSCRTYNAPTLAEALAKAAAELEVTE